MRICEPSGTDGAEMHKVCPAGFGVVWQLLVTIEVLPPRLLGVDLSRRNSLKEFFSETMIAPYGLKEIECGLKIHCVHKSTNITL